MAKYKISINKTVEIEAVDGSDERGFTLDGVVEILRGMLQPYETQANLARAIGISKQRLSSILCGQSKPYAKTVAFLGLKKIDYYIPVEERENDREI